MRKVCVVTGTRADYGIYMSILDAIEDHSKLELMLVATGMHFSEQHGYTFQLVKEAYPSVIAADIVGESMGKDTGEMIIKLNEIFKEQKPALVLVLGDRNEMLAATVAALYQQIPVAHLHGGEVSGCIDEQIRHAISKMSHVHFPATPLSGERLQKMGEPDDRIFVVGAAGLDQILSNNYLPYEKVLEKIKLASGTPYLMWVQHPDTLKNVEQNVNDLTVVIKALESLEIPTVLIYPNNDEGSSKMIKVLDQFNPSWVSKFKNLPREEYLGFLKYASCLIGNSSSGIIEAASFKTPVVNLGTRQLNRETASNVIHTSFELTQVLTAVDKALSPTFNTRIQTVQNPYGNGTAGKQIADILAEIKLDNLLVKPLSY